MLILKYSMFNLINEFNKNEHLIEAYLKNQPIEGYTGDPDDPNNPSGTIMGVTIGIFIAIFAIFLILWIWGLVITIKYWNLIPAWAQALAIIGLVFGVPIITLIVVYVSKGSKGGGGRRRRR